MIDFETAKQIAIKHIGSDCGLIEEAIIEKPYGWYFCYQSKAYLETGDSSHIILGNRAFFVEREGGRILILGFLDYRTETWFANYEKGFKYELYDLTVLNVRDRETTVQLLHRLNMQYVVPEWAYGTEWRIPKQYTVGEIKHLLKKLPYTFTGLTFQLREEIFYQIDETQCCEYVLNGYYVS